MFNWAAFLLFINLILGAFLLVFGGDFYIEGTYTNNEICEWLRKYWVSLAMLVMGAVMLSVALSFLVS